MQIRRARSAGALVHIKDRLMETGDLKKEDFLSVLAWRLSDSEASKATFVVVVIDDEDKNKVIGHLVATAEPLVDYIWVYEAEYDAKIGVEKAIEMTHKIREASIAWATSLNRHAIRMQTKRDPEAWKRKWGFESVATVLELRLDTVMSDQLFEEIQPSAPAEKENDNGRRNSDKGIGSDGRPTTSDRTSGEAARQQPAAASGEPDREAGGTVHGSTSREDRSGDDATRDSRPATEPASQLSEFHERYLSSVERANGV